MADDHRSNSNCPGKDVVRMGPDVGGGHRPFIRHTADHRVEGGFLRQAREGEPLQDGAVLLSETEDSGVYNVDYEYKAEGQKAGQKAAGSGPAQVATDDYRRGWDNIFGNKTVGQA